MNLIKMKGGGNDNLCILSMEIEAMKLEHSMNI